MAQRVRIAVLCSFNLDLLKRPLSAALSQAGLEAELYFSGYGLWETGALDPQSELHRFGPDAVILFADTADLLPPLAHENLLPKRAEAKSAGLAAWQRVETAIGGLSANLSPQSVVMVHNLARPATVALGTLE